MSAAEIFTGRSFKHQRLLRTLEFLSTTNDKLKLDTQFEKLRLSQVRIHFSIFGLCLIQYRPKEIRSGLLSNLYKILHSAGEKSILPNIERSSIELSKIEISNKRVRSGESVVKFISAHYAKSVIVGALKILASPDMWASVLENVGDSAAESEDRQIRLAGDRAKFASVSSFGDGFRLGMTVSFASHISFCPSCLPISEFWSLKFLSTALCIVPSLSLSLFASSPAVKRFPFYPHFYAC
mmetsp:Transcript_28487/g.59554  ORF Transcript_28487/g.59554 Transcript_28487/m.59554 type:complete len:239 (-) Transcript_28487:2124-2840(-)